MAGWTCAPDAQLPGGLFHSRAGPRAPPGVPSSAPSSPSQVDDLELRHFFFFLPVFVQKPWLEDLCLRFAFKIPVI